MSCKQCEEYEASIRTLLENNDRLTKAINGMPEWERAAKAASSQERLDLMQALHDALALLDDLNSMAQEEWLSDAEKSANQARIDEWEKLISE